MVHLKLSNNVLYILTLCLLAHSACGQKSIPPSVQAENPKFDKTIQRYLSFSMPVISVDSLATLDEPYILLDARERTEFDVSHIPGALMVGYDHFPESSIDSLDKDLPVIVYCSIGYRSEKVAEALEKMGFKDVRNLYGSIFEWVNSGYEVVDSSSQRVNRVHGYSRQWSKWIDNSSIEKVY